MNTLDTKLFVFSRKEVALIFMIVLSLTITSFALGVKFGKRYYLQVAGVQQSDLQEVELKSVEEEKVNEIMGSRTETTDDGESDDWDDDETEELKKDSTDVMHERLKNQIIKELKNEGSTTNAVAMAKTGEASAEGEDIIANSMERSEVKDKAEVLEAVEDKIPLKDKYSGKYTIQLGSHRSLKEAEDFANGFKIRGYNPIVNEVKLQKTGTWYRVSLGVFDTVSEAKEYVLKEKSLFEGQDYLFVQFD